MDTSRWPEADAILDEALALPSSERDAFVARVAGGDAALLGALRSVLAEADQDDGFLAPGGARESGVFSDLCLQLSSLGDTAPGLTPGAQVGPYEVVSELGRGGMGEVYRARDVRLGREVALKVLPPALADDPARRARLDREARVLASLAHPRIASLFDTHEFNGGTALVLELVEGPTLGERLAEGPLGERDAVLAARDIAEGLAAAHARDVVHRDLKPSNVKLTSDGRLKLLDFGLAKAVSLDADGLNPRPFVTAEHQPGVLVGTPTYMSPEQVRGQAVDHRADIWAFGCLLFEMLAGVPAFGRGTPAEVFARVLERSPQYDLLPASTGEPLRRLVRRCLEKDPERRLGYIGDAILDLDDALAPPVPGVARPAQRTPATSRRVAVGVALVAALAGLAWVGVWRLQRPAPEVLRVAIVPPETDELVLGQLPGLALTPDGRTAVYRARREGVIRLFRRGLDEAEGQPLPGTEGAATPFVSPDGQWVGFDRDGALLKARLDGSALVRLCEAPGGVIATWSPLGRIVFAAGASRVLQMVPEGGGAPQSLTTLDRSQGESAHLYPEFLPDGRSLLFTIVRHDEARLAVLDVETKAVTELLPGQQAKYLPSGHLAFIRESTLWAVPFDRRHLAVTGVPVPLVPRIHSTSGGRGAHFTVASSGNLLYIPLRDDTPLRTLAWVDRQGSASELPLEPRPYTRLGLSPDGTRIALGVADFENQDIWVYDLAKETLTRVTFDAGVDTAPVWSPDGRVLIIRSAREGGGLYAIRADGSGMPERLTRSGGPVHIPASVTRDGRHVLFSEFRSYRDQRIGRVALEGGREISWLVEGPAAQTRPQLSPDNRWLAYQSDESGRFEIYVRPYPEVGVERWQVSPSGGTSPVWARDGRELFFHDGRRVVAVAVQAGRGFRVGPAKGLFDLGATERLGPVFDAAPDGRRFLVIQQAPPPAASAARPHLSLVHNWMAEVQRLVPSQ